MDYFKVGHANNDTWQKAFNEYNNDHSEERPLKMACRPCFYKVAKYLIKKYYVQSE